MCLLLLVVLVLLLVCLLLYGIVVDIYVVIVVVFGLEGVVLCGMDMVGDWCWLVLGFLLLYVVVLVVF